jgi:hypothetical protein
MPKEFLKMSLKECGAYDHANNLKAKLSGWGIICKDRQVRGVSRKARRLRRQAAGAAA